MKQLKIALTALAAESGISQENWKTVPLKGADLTDRIRRSHDKPGRNSRRL